MRIQGIAVTTLLSAIAVTIGGFSANAYDSEADVWFEFADSRIDESSGVASSSTDSELIFTHNDSGGGPFVWAVDASGATVVRYRILNSNFDWEDITWTWGTQGGASLVIADIGDNLEGRSTVRLIEIDEPDPRADAADKANSALEVEVQPTATFELTYPGGPADAEAVLIDPATRALAIVTKSSTGNSIVYGGQYPTAATDQIELTEIARLDLGQLSGSNDERDLVITSGAVAPDGSSFVLRTPDLGWEWALLNGDFAAALETSPIEVAMPDTIQGEAITYSTDGSYLITTTEGEGAPVHIIGGGILRQRVGAPTTVATADANSDNNADSPVLPSGRPLNWRIWGVAAIVAILVGGLLMVAIRRR